MAIAPANLKLEKVILAGLILPQVTRTVVEEHLEELGKLAEAAGGTVVGQITAKRSSPDSAMYVGKGKAEEINSLVKSRKAALVVFDDDLSPAQIRNLEKAIEAKVIDRSALILDIFARRARSREAQTQVELAQLNYLMPRLTRAWTHLSRQAGGIGTRGVGETQLELDRRIIKTRISKLKGELAKIELTRETQRRSRTAFTVALVGYTNAGKSTLFNQLTAGSAEAVNKLFATLDSKVQKIHFPMPEETVIIDTVGFIRKLPHHLVASFRSTMEEAVSADVVLHVIDLTHPQFEDQRAVGEEVLKALGIDDAKIIDVYNKADILESTSFRPLQERPSATLSALTGLGVEKLLELIRARELKGGELVDLQLPIGDSRLLAQLHEMGKVLEQKADDHTIRVRAWIPNGVLHHFESFITSGRTRSVSDPVAASSK